MDPKIRRGYFQLSTRAQTPSLQIYVVGAEFQLIDTLGRRVGYDPITQNIITEIPYSSYFDSSIIPPGEIPVDYLRRILYLSEEAQGVYSFTVFSMSTISTLATSDIKVYSLDMMRIMRFSKRLFCPHSKMVMNIQ